MTPKEKAFHLHFSFIRDVSADNEKAKICAVKVIDEILKSKPLLPSIAPQITIDRCCTQAKEYWEEVKQEIQEL
jgi:hypothetical protein